MHSIECPASSFSFICCTHSKGCSYCTHLCNAPFIISECWSAPKDAELVDARDSYTQSNPIASDRGTYPRPNLPRNSRSQSAFRRIDEEVCVLRTDPLAERDPQQFDDPLTMDCRLGAYLRSIILGASCKPHICYAARSIS